MHLLGLDGPLAPQLGQPQAEEAQQPRPSPHAPAVNGPAEQAMAGRSHVRPGRPASHKMRCCNPVPPPFREGTLQGLPAPADPAWGSGRGLSHPTPGSGTGRSPEVARPNRAPPHRFRDPAAQQHSRLPKIGRGNEPPSPTGRAASLRRPAGADWKRGGTGGSEQPLPRGLFPPKAGEGGLAGNRGTRTVAAGRGGPWGRNHKGILGVEVHSAGSGQV